MFVDARRWIKQYQRMNGLKGHVNKDNVELICHKDYDDYSMDENEGCEFITEIGTEVDITAGRLKGLPRCLKLTRGGLPSFVRDLITKPIVVELNQTESANIDEETFTAGETDLANEHSATFTCEVELDGCVLFNTANNWGYVQSCDEVHISEILEDTAWTVEGECTFHLGLNDSIEWL